MTPDSDMPEFDRVERDLSLVGIKLRRYGVELLVEGNGKREICLTLQDAAEAGRRIAAEKPQGAAPRHWKRRRYRTPKQRYWSRIHAHNRNLRKRAIAAGRSLENGGRAGSKESADGLETDSNKAQW